MTEPIDIDTLTGPAAPVEHCGQPMRWLGSKCTWDGLPGEGYSITATDWTCECGATLKATVRVPS